MVDTGNFKDWWAEARANDGVCDFWHSWWDAKGGKPEEERVIPGDLTTEQLFTTVAPSALMKLPMHYYANYSDDTWRKLARTTELSIVNAKFSLEGRKVDATMRVNVYKSMFIDTPAMADAIDILFTRWAEFAQRYPGAGMRLFVSSKDKAPVITTSAYDGVNAGELMVAEAAFSSVMADLASNPGFVAWVANMVQQGGRNTKSFDISEEVWFGSDNPTTERVRYEVSGGKRGKAPNFGMAP